MSATQSPAPKWLSRKEASRFLETLGCPISPGSLTNFAANGNARGGPPYYKVGKRVVRYHPDDLTAWAKARTLRIA